MSKLSEPLKTLINAAHALPNTIKAPPNIRTTYARIADSARSHNVGVPAFLTLSVSTISLHTIYKHGLIDAL